MMAPARCCFLSPLPAVAGAVALLAAALLAPAPAAAFIRTTTCVPDNPAHPFACLDGEEPLPIAWPDACVGYEVQQDGTRDFPDADALAAIIDEAFAVWRDVECATFEAVRIGLTASRVVGVTDGQPNGNIVLFVDNGWRHARNIQALTSVSYRPSNGEIADADIEMNSEFFAFGVVDASSAAGTTDLLNTLVHEVGHFVGLDHTTGDGFVGDPADVSLATMFAAAQAGEIGKRTLEDDDIAGVCAIYPSPDGRNACSCPPEGCAEAESRRGCASAGPGALGWALALLPGLAVLRRRRT
jgi:uncharacterized protein (TIGR03382 family)